MMTILSIVGMIGGIGAVVHYTIKGFAYIASKTSNKVDDKIAKGLEDAEPVLVDVVKGLADKPAVPVPAPRPTTVDHRH